MELYAEITLEVAMKPKRGQSLFIPSRDGKRESSPARDACPAVKDRS